MRFNISLTCYDSIITQPLTLTGFQTPVRVEVQVLLHPSTESVKHYASKIGFLYQEYAFF